MATISSMTQKEFIALLDNYFAEPNKRAKMTMDQVKVLASKLNEKINIPLVRETKEERIFVKIILKIDNFLYDNMPNEFYELWKDTHDGIDDEEAKQLIKRLTKLANKKIDIPYIPEAIEAFVFKFIIGILVNAARKGWDFDSANSASDKIDATKTGDTMLEAMVIDTL